jgi:hypothetical protein
LLGSHVNAILAGLAAGGIAQPILTFLLREIGTDARFSLERRLLTVQAPFLGCF